MKIVDASAQPGLTRMGERYRFDRENGEKYVVRYSIDFLSTSCWSPSGQPLSETELVQLLEYFDFHPKIQQDLIKKYL